MTAQALEWTDPEWWPLIDLQFWMDLCDGCGAWLADHCNYPECDLHIVLHCHAEHREAE